MRCFFASAVASAVLGGVGAHGTRIRRLSEAGQTVSCIADWVSVNYTWPTPDAYASAVADGTYVPANNIITGVKIWNNTVYVTVPRWRHGVPATLSTVVMPQQGTGADAECQANQPLLQPYPSWDFQSLDNPAGLKYTQSMEIEPATGLMWMLDVGRLNIYDPEQPPINTSPPKLILYSIPDNAVVQTYLFTDDVAPYSSSFLNDVVVDVTDGIAYISDASGPGAIIVYDRTRNVARRFSDASTAADPSVVIAINSVIYPGINTPSDGIALSPDRSTLFYCALRGQTLYAVPTSALRNFMLTTAQISAQVVNMGNKPPSDGMTFSNLGELYFGDLNGDRVVQTDTSAKPFIQSTLASNATTMQWQDTFGWGGPGELIFTTNRLQLFIAGTLDITGASGANMRIFVASVPGQSNYMADMAPYNPFPGPPPGPPGGGEGDYKAAHAAAVTMGVLFAFAAAAAGGLGCVMYRRRVAAARTASANADAGYAQCEMQQPQQYGVPLQPQQQYGAPVTVSQATTTTSMMAPAGQPAYAATGPAPVMEAQTANLKPMGGVGTQPIQPAGGAVVQGDSTLKAKRAGAGFFYDLRDAIGDIGRKLSNSMSRTNAGVPRPEQIQPRPTSVAAGPGVAPMGAVGGAGMDMPMSQVPVQQPGMVTQTGMPLVSGAPASFGGSTVPQSGPGIGGMGGIGGSTLTRETYAASSTQQYVGGGGVPVGTQQYAGGGGVGAQQYAQAAAPMQVPSIAPSSQLPQPASAHRPVPALPVGTSQAGMTGLGVSSGAAGGYGASGAGELPVSTAK